MRQFKLLIQMYTLKIHGQRGLSGPISRAEGMARNSEDEDDMILKGSLIQGSGSGTAILQAQEVSLTWCFPIDIRVLYINDEVTKGRI